MTAPLPTDTPDQPFGLYGVTVEDVARELPGTFPQGITPDGVVPRDLVRRWVVSADTEARLFVGALGLTPDATPLGADLVREYIKAAVIVKVIRTVYELNGATDIGAAIASWAASFTSARAALTAYAAELAGATVIPSRVRSSFPDRAPLVDDAQLDGSRRIRSAT